MKITIFYLFLLIGVGVITTLITAAFSYYIVPLIIGA